MKMTRTLLKNGTIVNFDRTERADVVIEGEKIVFVGAGYPEENSDVVIDASQKLLFPGGIDVHTHMELPLAGTFSHDTFSSGSLAALHGGTTTIIDFAMQSPGGSLKQALDTWHHKASGQAVCDYSFHLGVVDLHASVLSEIPNLIEREGISSFKAFTAYRDIMLSGPDLKLLMSALSDRGGLLCLHCEDGLPIEKNIKANIAAGKLHPRFHALSRPADLERTAIAHIAKIAKEVGHQPYVVHLSSADGLREIEKIRNEGQFIHAETCPQYLLLDESLYTENALESAKFVLSPPLRPKSHQNDLWRGLKNGLIHVIATDHCPFTLKQKSRGLADFSKIPNGLPGVENRMELMYGKGVLESHLSLNQFVDAIAAAPAKIFGMFPQKGNIGPGSDADIVIFDPTQKQVISAAHHHMNCDYSAYEGMEITGRCEKVFLRGHLVIDKGVSLVKEGFGSFIKRKACANIF